MVARFELPVVLSRRRLAIPETTPTPGGSGVVDIIRVTGQALKWLRPGDTCYGEFQTRHPSTGVLTAPASPPTIEIVRNNVTDLAVSVTVTSPSTGRYRYSFTVPNGYDPGDFVSAVASATIASLLDVASLIDTRLVAMDWTSPGSGGGDPLLNPVPGSYAENTAGFALGTVASSVAANLVASRNVTVGSVVIGSTINLVIGDDYLQSDGNAVRLPPFTVTGSYPDFDGAQCVLFLPEQGIEIEGEIITESGSTRQVQFDFPSSFTSGLKPVNQKYSVVITLQSGSKVTPWRGQLVAQNR